MSVRVITVMLLLACLLSGSAQDLKEDERLQFAQGLFARGMHELALKEYETFSKDFPASAKADVVQFRMGECYRAMGNRAAADKAFRAVFTGFPQSPLRLKAGVRRADLFAEAEQYEEASALYAQVLKENPPEEVAAACWYLMGESLLKAGKKAEAGNAFEEVRRKYLTSAFHPYALVKLGALYAENPARTDEVIALYTQVAEKPGSERMGAEALFQMGEMYFIRKDYTKSADAYGKLITKYPEDRRASEARLQAAWACYHSGLHAVALEYAAKALGGALGDQKAEWLYLKANIERQLLKSDDSITTYDRLLAEHPGNRFEKNARYEKMLTFFKTGRHAEAVAEGLKIPRDPALSKDVYWLLAESYAALKDDDHAIQYYRLIVKEYPQSELSSDASYRLAHRLHMKGEFKEASSHYLTVATGFPDSKLAPAALFGSAVCLARSDQHEQAARDWAGLIQKYPDDPLVEDALYQKAVSEIRLKRDADARGSLVELLRRFPASKFMADAHYWQGLLYQEAGKPAEAEEEFQLCLKANPTKEIEREAQFQLAILLQKKGESEPAAGLFMGLLKSPLREKFTPPLLQWLAEFQCGKRAFREAAAAAELMIERGPEPAWQQTGWCLLGRCRMALKDMAGAEEAFRKALDAKANTPFGGEAAFHLGEVTLASGKFDDAVKFYRMAAEMAADESELGVRARAYIGLAKGYKGKGDHENTARYFMSVAILYEDPVLVPACLYEAVKALQLSGKAEEAKKTAKELRERYPESEWAKRTDLP